MGLVLFLCLCWINRLPLLRVLLFDLSPLSAWSESRNHSHVSTFHVSCFDSNNASKFDHIQVDIKVIHRHSVPRPWWPLAICDEMRVFKRNMLWELRVRYEMRREIERERKYINFWQFYQTPAWIRGWRRGRRKTPRERVKSRQRTGRWKRNERKTKQTWPTWIKHFSKRNYC